MALLLLFFSLVTVRNVRAESCSQIAWDYPNEVGDRISGYRVRVYNGRRFATSLERRVFHTTMPEITLTWLPTKGPVKLKVKYYKGIE